MAETGYIVFYVTLYSIVALLGSFGAEGLNDDDTITAFPEIEEGGGFFDALAFPFQIVGYFLTLQGLTIFSISPFIAGILSTILTVPMIYVISRLVRGGG